jgi:hypothetical protein
MVHCQWTQLPVLVWGIRLSGRFWKYLLHFILLNSVHYWHYTIHKMSTPFYRTQFPALTSLYNTQNIYPILSFSIPCTNVTIQYTKYLPHFIPLNSLHYCHYTIHKNPQMHTHTHTHTHRVINKVSLLFDRTFPFSEPHIKTGRVKVL